MTYGNNAGPIFRPYEKLVRITILEREAEVPEGNILLRCFQFLAPEEIAYGPFCWNEECQHCRVVFDMGEGSQQRQALSCKLVVTDGMRVVDCATEIRMRLREALRKCSAPKPPELNV